jgi:hypothetical protein
MSRSKDAVTAYDCSRSYAVSSTWCPLKREGRAAGWGASVLADNKVLAILKMGLGEEP